MNSAVKSTSNNMPPNINRRKGRAEVNNVTKEIRRIGEERLLSLYDLQYDMAHNAIDEKNRLSAQQYLLDKGLPKALPRSFVNIALQPMNSIDDIKENEKVIMQKVSEGSISLEAAVTLYSMCDQARKTFEATQIATMIEEMDKRMKDNGI